MKERIHQDFLTINELNQEVHHLKTDYAHIKEEITSLSFSCEQTDSF